MLPPCSVQEKTGYKAALSRLKALKPEVEHLQLLLERGQRKMQDDFRAWHGIMLRRYQSSCSVDLGTPMENARGSDSLRSSEAAVKDAPQLQRQPSNAVSSKLLTGNAEADESIRGFYAARASLLRSQSFTTG